MTIASLVVDIAANTASLTKSVESVQGSLSSMSGMATKVAGVLGAAFAASEISSAAGEVTQYAGHLDDLRKKAGITAEAVQELDFAAKQNGLSFETVSGALAKMSKNILEGGKASQGAISDLGLSVNDLKAMAPDLAFQAIAEKIAGIEDPMQRSNAAMNIFGKSGAQLLPLLTENIGQLRQQARDAGLVLSNELVASGDKLGDSWDQMQGRLNALKAQALLPVLDLFTQLPAPMQTIVGAGLALAPSLGGIGTAIVAAGGPVAAMGALSSAFTAILPFLGPAGLVAVAVFAVYEIWKHWDKISAIAQGVYTAVKTWLVDKFEAIVGAVKAKVDAVTGFFAGMYDKVVGHSFVPDMITRIGQEFAKLPAVMVEPTTRATARTSGAFGGLFDSITSGLGKFQGTANSLMSAALGGAGLEGTVRAGLTSIGNVLLPGFGNLLGKLAPVVSEGLKKIGNMFKSLFGGPSASELAGRDLVAHFEANLSSMLTESQRLEAGTDSWKQTVIALRDQYLAMGLTEQQALADAKRLWDSSRAGADAARRVIEDIQSTLAGGFNVPVRFDVGALSLPGTSDFPGVSLDVPQLARGGVTTGPTLAWIGEAGREAVVPLDRAAEFRGGGRGDTSGLREEFAAMRDHIERQGAMLARLPKDIARAVRDKRQLSLVRSRRAW